MSSKTKYRIFCDFEIGSRKKPRAEIKRDCETYSIDIYFKSTLTTRLSLVTLITSQNLRNLKVVFHLLSDDNGSWLRLLAIIRLLLSLLFSLLNHNIPSLVA